MAGRNGLTEADVRRILREELAKLLDERLPAPSTPPEPPHPQKWGEENIVALYGARFPRRG